MTTNLPEWVDSHFQELIKLDANIVALKDNLPTFKEACELLVKLSEFKTAMAIIYSQMENIVLEVFESEDVYVADDGTTIEKKFDTNRKGWKHKDLAEVVAERINSMAVDMDTGEVVLSSRDMIIKLLDFVQPSYWRLKPLNEIGVNPDDYCTVGDTKPVISLRKGKS